MTCLVNTPIALSQSVAAGERADGMGLRVIALLLLLTTRGFGYALSVPSFTGSTSHPESPDPGGSENQESPSSRTLHVVDKHGNKGLTGITAFLENGVLLVYFGNSTINPQIVNIWNAKGTLICEKHNKEVWPKDSFANATMMCPATDGPNYKMEVHGDTSEEFVLLDSTEQADNPHNAVSPIWSTETTAHKASQNSHKGLSNSGTTSQTQSVAKIEDSHTRKSQAGPNVVWIIVVVVVVILVALIIACILVILSPKDFSFTQALNERWRTCIRWFSNCKLGKRLNNNLNPASPQAEPNEAQIFIQDPANGHSRCDNWRPQAQGIYSLAPYCTWAGYARGAGDLAG